MKNLVYKSVLAFAAILCLGACKKNGMNVRLTDVGPNVTVNSYSESAFMGGEVAYSVALDDSEFALSTLQVSLLFDETVVADSTFRTKEEGTYSGTLTVPFYKNIPDGTATLRFKAVNTGTGATTKDVGVQVTRPVFDALYLMDESGNQIAAMSLTDEAYTYSVTEEFPTEVNAYIYGTYKDVDYFFGWVDSAIDCGSTELIPFSNGVAGEYSITFNTLTFEASPFASLTVNGTDATMVDKNNYEAVVNLTQNGTVTIEGYAPGFEDWTIDPDFFEETGTDGSYTFLATSGLYKVNIGLADKFFTVSRMASTSEYGDYSTTGSVWMIGGSCFGKPKVFSGSWDPDEAALCFAEVSNKVHQLTFIAGQSLSTSGINVKIFHQKGWGGEFTHEDITTDSDLVYIGDGDTGDDGNIYTKDGVTLDFGGIYRFTLDINSGVLHFEKIGEVEIETENISLNGEEFSMVSTTEYEITTSLSKDQTLKITGLDDLASYYLDPDYLYLDGATLKFNAMSGNYHISLYTDSKYVTIQRMMDSDSSETATLEDGHAIWLMGWGGAHPVMTSQFGWSPSKAYCMAEVDDLVFQFTGIAVQETDGETMGGRFRTDYVSIKYFSQQGWGNECGKPYGESTSIVLTERASKLINENDTNIELNGDLEEGATYVLVVDLSKAQSDLIETIDFYKK